MDSQIEVDGEMRIHRRLTIPMIFLNEKLLSCNIPESLPEKIAAG